MVKMLCRSIMVAVGLLGVGLSAMQPLRADDAPKLPTALGSVTLENGDSIVFLGDSITHQCLYTQYVEDYFYTRMSHLRLKLHNAGVGGARAWDALQRFDEDVASYKPKYVTILLGMNDGTYRPYDEATFQTYRQDMTALLDQLQGLGATAIPMTPTMFDARADRARPNNKRDPESQALYNSVLAYYGAWLREVSVERGLGFVDMYGPLNTITLEQRKTDAAFTLIQDAIHPGAPGQVVMATAMITDMGLPRQLSNITITVGSGGPKAKRDNGGGLKATGRASGGKLSDIAVTETGVAFTFHPQSLPWVLPEEAQLGAKLTKLGHKLSREALDVHGLAPGQYQLLIDGVEVGTYSSATLERHIELQENAKTPQYQQALAVANLNKERNEKAVRKLRGEWSQYQQFARARRTATEKPDDEQAQKQLATLTEKITGMAERVAQANEEARSYEDRIFEINQPRSVRYELKRVEMMK
ncbi:MAG: SGNH/GDSL hydrolase family protein [Planctomycetaceae bacterium]